MLPEKDHQRAIEESKKADLSIVIGSSLNVTPACEFPEMTVKNGGKLVIINLMETKYDEQATLTIFAKSDDVFTKLFELLNLKIPDFKWNTNVWLGNKCELIQNKSRKRKDESKDLEWTLFVAGDCGYQSYLIQKAEIQIQNKPSQDIFQRKKRKSDKEK